MEYCNHLLVLKEKEYYFGGNLNSWLLTPLFLVFRGTSPDNSIDMVSFPLAWEEFPMSPRFLLFIPHLLLGVDGSNFLADFSAISACSTSSRYGLWQPPCEPLLGLRSCACMSVRAWVMASLLGTSKISSWTAQCSLGQIRPSSARWRGVCPWLPRCRPRKNEKEIEFLSRSRNWQSLEEDFETSQMLPPLRCQWTV